MNFAFGKRTEQVNWRKLAAVDLNRLTRDMDVKTLQDNILNVTYCNIEAELDMQGVSFDPNFIKLFNLAQLIIEYLLHSQEYLSSNLESEVKKVQETMQSAEEVRKELEQKSESQNKLKKEIKKLKKWIAEYQLMMRAGASGIHKCPYCAKAFVSQEYLTAHLARRHSDSGEHMNGYITSVKPVNITVSSKPTTNGEVDQDKLVLLDEMKQIKDRLYATERDLMNERAAREKSSAMDKNQFLSDQSKFKEMEENYENWKRMEEDKHKREMENLRNTLLQQMQELQMQSQAEKESFNQAISDLEFKMRTRPSMVGSIKDEDEPDGPSKGDIADMMKEQLEKIKVQNQDDMQQEMKRLNKKWKTKEEKLQTDHDNEMNKVRGLLSQYEDKLKNERSEKDELNQIISDLNKKLNEHDKAIKDSKVAAEQYQRTVRQQPILATPPVPRREVTFSDQELLERDRVKTPDFSESQDESMTLFVAANSNRSQYRLWRQRAEGSSEWVDKFSFNAYVRPVGPFTTPVYVYAASGSPYWRQSIYDSSKPPSNEYRLDYMFYASQSPVLGSIQLHVLDAGSLPVIRSCVYKSKDLPGWKYKGFSFYIMKSNQKGVNVSSSWDGEQDSEESESELEEIDKVSEVMKESLESVDTKELTSGISSSEWGTETLQRGVFHPIKHNPDITTHYQHTHEEVMACRQEIEQMLEQRLNKQGLQPSIGRLSSEKLDARMAAFAIEKQARSKKIRNYDHLRNSLSELVEDIVKRNYKKNGTKDGDSQQLGPRQSSTSPTSRSKPPTMRAAATVVRASSSLQQSKNSTRSSVTLTSTGSQDMGLSTGDQSFSGTSVTERTLSESEDEDYSDDSQDASEWDSTGNSLTPASVTGARVQQRALHTNPKVSVRIPTQDTESDPEDIQTAPISTHKNTGTTNVRGLANTLERRLGNNSPGKKPVGGIALPGKQDDFDDSDFSLSSIEEKSKPTQLTRAELNRTGNHNGSNPVPAPRARPQPSPRKDVPSSSAVEAFSVDDLSDFDDSDLETHHL